MGIGFLRVAQRFGGIQMRVTDRPRQTGVRLAVGAAAKLILLQSLTEAMIVSLSGGLIGILVAGAIPLNVSAFTDRRIPISWMAIMVAFGISCLVDLLFGILPAKHPKTVRGLWTGRFAGDVLHGSDRADEIADESLDHYGERRG